MALTVAWWKKQKPLTVRDETLTNALEQLEKFERTRNAADNWSWDDVDHSVKALEAVEAAIALTIAKLNERTHATLISNLGELNAEAYSLKTEIQRKKTTHRKYRQQFIASATGAIAQVEALLESHLQPAGNANVGRPRAGGQPPPVMSPPASPAIGRAHGQGPPQKPLPTFPGPNANVGRPRAGGQAPPVMNAPPSPALGRAHGQGPPHNPLPPAHGAGPTWHTATPGRVVATTDRLDFKKIQDFDSASARVKSWRDSINRASSFDPVMHRMNQYAMGVEETLGKLKTASVSGSLEDPKAQGPLGELQTKLATWKEMLDVDPDDYEQWNRQRMKR